MNRTMYTRGGLVHLERRIFSSFQVFLIEIPSYFRLQFRLCLRAELHVQVVQYCCWTILNVWLYLKAQLSR